MQEKIPYIFHKGEAGTFVEIYLPKKALYQGTLYTTLTNGFKNKHVIDHFTDNKEMISDVIMEYYPELPELFDKFCAKYERVFWGYSMYEVDGVFFNAKKRKLSKQISEERTQVIRLMFKPNLSKYKKMEYTRMITLVKTFFQAPLSKTDYYLDHYKKSYLLGNEKFTKKEIALLKYLGEWVQRVIIFTIGYVVYEICREISILKKDKMISEYEEEIWVTSFWNLLVHRVNLDQKAKD